ncbi:hypothetical protein [Streptomyces sp. NPDC051776]|uniref:hypothetical protein n=1 Tax=Streptomyces sp. NPDC051776 TaxID=3155414 RepID=UPI003441C1A1
MRVNKIATATMLVLAVSGWTAVGAGTAFAGSGPDQGKAKARAEGGSTTGGGLFQQNIAQSSRQNNNCNNPNTAPEDAITLTGSRAAGRCATADGSLTAFSRTRNGPAHAEGGTSTLSLAQQNTAQRGRQNNNCHNPNDSDITVEGSRVEGLCLDRDFSFAEHTSVTGGGARAEGGSSAGVEGNLRQQNTAQEGRQNNTCNNPSGAFPLDVTGGRVEGRCGNKDGSYSKHARIKGGGA